MPTTQRPAPVHYSYSRLMEKDNKKARDDARKDYNDTVRVSRFDLDQLHDMTHHDSE